MMVGERMAAALGPGEWVVYYYRSDPQTLYSVGPYTVVEADAVAALLRSPSYRRGGYRGAERVTV